MATDRSKTAATVVVTPRRPAFEEMTVTNGHGSRPRRPKDSALEDHFRSCWNDEMSFFDDSLILFMFQCFMMTL